MKPNPCVHCGRSYTKRDCTSQFLTWPAGTPMPKYTGNLRVWKEVIFSKDDGTHTMHGARHLWDGETWTGGYPPFCTLRCALDYARISYRRAMKKQRGNL